MIPYKDENPTHHIPFVTYTIICLNTLAWIFVQGMGVEPVLSESICSYGIIPGAVLDRGIVEAAGNVCNVSYQQGWVAFTSMFMHGSWLHLLGNMWFMWLFADNIEDVLRPVKFIMFYLVGGIAAVAGQMLADANSMIPMVGASGAIGGIMGAYAWLYPTVRVRIAIILGFFVIRSTIPAWAMLGIWFGVQLLSGLISLKSSTGAGVAFWAHIGGFLAGFFLIQLIYRRPPPVKKMQ